MYALALSFLHKTKVEISLMNKTLLKANISNTFADYRLTLQQVQVHVIYIQSTNNPSTSLGALCMPCHLEDPVYVFTISADPGLDKESLWLFENVMFFKLKAIFKLRLWRTLMVH